MIRYEALVRVSRRQTAMLSTIAEIIRDLLIFVGVITALLIALVVVISKMPDTNPLKRILTALSYRLGATLAAGGPAIPPAPITREEGPFCHCGCRLPHLALFHF